jgi:DNA replication protein DnaC
MKSFSMADDEWKIVAEDIVRRISAPAHDAAVRQWEKRQAELQYESRIREADIPSMLVDDITSPTLDLDRHPTPAIDQALKGGQRMILLTGTPGTGKTVAATCAVLRFRGAYFLRVPDYLAMIQSYQTRWNAERASLRSALVLDELGEEQDRHRPEVDSLLSFRYSVAANHVTITTTNLTTSAFREAYGERIVSRFRDPRYCVIISCKDTIRPRRTKR